MGKPITQWTHLRRLGIVVVLVVVGFIAGKNLAQPPSWNSVVWYRGASLDDIAQLPMSYGGNESCQHCHKDDNGPILGPGHLGLSCESCHGPLVDHIKGGDKIGDAIVINESTEQCMNCHSEQINRPASFPQYRYQHGERMVRRQKSERGGKQCMGCHSPHAPDLPSPII